MDNLTTFTAAALLALLVYTAQNLVRFIRARDWNGVLGILLAWLVGAGAAWLAAQADITDDLRLITNGPTLGNLDAGSLILLGLGLGSGASAFHDWNAARDDTDSAKTPPLVPSSTTEP